MTPAILTQQQLIARLRDELGMRVGPPRIRAWIREGMPTAPKGGLKKPRFIWDLAKDWLLQGAQPTPMRQEARDRLFLARLKKGA